MKVNCFLIATEARVVPDEGLHIAGTFDGIALAPLAHAPPNTPIPWPDCYLAAHFEFSEADGLDHRIAIEVHTDDGRRVFPRAPIGTFAVPVERRAPPGRPRRAPFVTRITGLRFPWFGTFALVLIVNDQEAARLTLYVDDSGS